MLGLTPTYDAHLWLRKWSTLLSALQGMFGAALVAWMSLPEDMRARFPDWVPTGIGTGVLLVALLTPLATNTVQNKLRDCVQS